MPSGSPLSVVRVAEDDWESYRDLRLAMLLDAPDAFWTTYADVADRDEAAWRRAATGVLCLQVRDEDDIPLGTLTVLLPAPAAAGEPAEFAPGDALVVAVYVVPEARGRGVGDALLRAARAVAREELGATRLVLHVNELNEPARALYARHGFTPTGATLAHPRQPGVRELELARPL